MYSSNRRPRRVEITDNGFDGFFTVTAVGNGPDPTHIMSKDDRDHHPQQRHTFPSANSTPFTPATSAEKKNSGRGEVYSGYIDCMITFFGGYGGLCS